MTNQVVTKNVSSAQRLPHVYLDDDLKPCIVVAGEEHNEETEQETNQHGDWHNITAGGKQVLVSKKPKNQKQPPKNSPVQVRFQNKIHRIELSLCFYFRSQHLQTFQQQQTINLILK